MQSEIVWHFKINRNCCFWKKQHKTSKNNQIPSKFGYVGQYVTYNKCRNFFLKKMLQRLRLPRNKGFPKNWHIFVLSTVRIHILPPETCSLNISKKVPKICKIVVYFELLQQILVCRKTKITQKKMLVVHQKQSKNVLLHMSWLTLKLATQ